MTEEGTTAYSSTRSANSRRWIARDDHEVSKHARKGRPLQLIEYSAAKEKQSVLEDKISAPAYAAGKREDLDTSKMDASKVQILSKVTILDMKRNKEKTYTIVSDNESNQREERSLYPPP